ncbi:pilus assembly protein CpaE [Rhodobacterales bacterium HKCCA1288]|jgi:pilus assembly protein CpaE|uniref:AAA family ATPase n=1 Tax=Roseovarius sp. 10 TaxID=3080563 RepID=UPI001935CA19|nr:pilus assembly protein CpaE [Roseovarius sp. 10]MDV7200988.1 pilus assembly protein CpaE [Roseovarius sp. 10]QPI85166.1 pilus assembly protein CpaE [Rhodobacterales bacterium HKCCA1288]
MSADLELGTSKQAFEPPLACTVARDVYHFDLLIEDMENLWGDKWGDLSFADAVEYFGQPEAQSLKLITVAVSHRDEEDIAVVAEIIRRAKGRGIRVLLVAGDVSPAMLHQFLKLGADDFVPYPLPDGALKDAVTRVLTAPSPTAQSGQAPQTARTLAGPSDLGGSVFAVHGLAGGVGATSFAVNLAWEMATIDATLKGAVAPRVCVIDLDLQFGNVATLLDLPRREMIVEILSDLQSMDSDAFCQALLGYRDKLSVFTAPADILPLDLIGPDDVRALISLARKNFDLVILDLPSALTGWSDAILNEVDIYFAVLELEMRSAQNALRFARLVRGEGLPIDRVKFILNRAPGLTDLNGKSRIKRLAESLDVSIKTLLPDGGKQVAGACDQGEPLAIGARKNPLRREIQKIATSLHGGLVQTATAA